MRRTTLSAVVVTIASALMAGYFTAPSAAYAATTGRIHGVVTMPDGSAIDRDITMAIYNVDTDRYLTISLRAKVANGGAYAQEDVPPGHYRIDFSDPAYGDQSVPILGGYWPDAYSKHPEQAGVVAVAAGDDITADFSLLPGYFISGSLGAQDGDLIDARVDATYVTTSDGVSVFGVPEHGSFDAATKTFKIGPLEPGAYVASFVAREVTGAPASYWRTEWWADQTTRQTANEIVIDDEDVDLEVLLDHRSGFSGVLTIVGSGPTSTLPSFWVTACSTTEDFCVGRVVGSTNTYAALDIPGGTYAVCFYDHRPLPPAIGSTAADNPIPSGDPFACWDGPVAVTSGNVTTGIDVVYERPGSITGTVWYKHPTTGTQISAHGATVEAYRLDEESGVYSRVAAVQADGGNFGLYNLRPGAYALRFVGKTVDSVYAINSEYWQDARYWDLRTDIEVGPGEPISLGRIVLEPRSLDVGRIAGADRFETAVAASRTLFSTVPTGGVPVLYIANGRTFPDALSAGPAAAVQGGGLLIVEKGSIPSTIKAELKRLKPQKIVVVGSSSAVSNSVFTQLKSYAPDVVRIGGADRYETSRLVVADAFGSAGSVGAFLATGKNFPDALAAGAAAASLGAPVILADGSKSGLDPQTKTLLTQLGIEDVYIAGSAAVVKPGIANNLVSMFGSTHVYRFGGSDRYETSVLINQAFFEFSDYALLANGDGFVDALAGGPVAGAFGAPLYLSKKSCIPVPVALDILDVDAAGLLLLGGTPVLGKKVANFTVC